MVKNFAAFGVVDIFAVRTFFIDIIAGIILATFFGYSHKYLVILLRFIAIAPLLQEEYARLGACMRLKSVAVETDDGENFCFFKKILAHILHIGVVQSSWGKQNAIRPPGRSISSVRSIKRMCRSTLFFILPFSFFANSY